MILYDVVGTQVSPERHLKTSTGDTVGCFGLQVAQFQMSLRRSAEWL
jgi:hypothetical protein